MSNEIKTAQNMGEELLEKSKAALKDFSNQQSIAEKNMSRLAETLDKYHVEEASLQAEINSLMKHVSEAIYNGQAETVETSRVEIRGLRQKLEDCQALIKDIDEGLIPRAETELKKASRGLRDKFIELLVDIRKADWDTQMDYHGGAMADLSQKWDEIIRQAAEASQVHISWGSISQDQIGAPSFTVETHDRMGKIYR